MPDALQQASLWGQVFEIAVKRGVLIQLQAAGWLQADDTRLAEWQELKVSHVYGALLRSFEATDENVRELLRQTCRHYFVMGFGLGQTLVREHARRIKPKFYRIKGLYCPLALPTLENNQEIRQQGELSTFYQGFGLPLPMDGSLLNKGGPAKADFLLCLAHTKGRKADELLCLEFSLNAPPKIADYTSPEAHLNELQTYARYLDMRGVFSQVTSEVRGESFSISPHLSQHFAAFTSQDKPLYKLCQGASYIDQTVKLLRRTGLSQNPVASRVISVTPYGFESLAARYDDAEADPRTELMATLGEAYRNYSKPEDNEEDVLARAVRQVFMRLSGALPSALRKEVKKLRTPPEPGVPFLLHLQESIEGFKNPMQVFSWEEASGLVNDSPALTKYFGIAAPERIQQALAQLGTEGREIPLRDLHAAAVVAGLQSAKPGQLNVLGLEGNPGIGKTTAVMNHLARLQEGFLFLYISPRVIINKDVSDKLARRGGEKTDVLTLTTNSKLNGAASAWYRDKVKNEGWPERRIENAVVVDGVKHLNDPKTTTLLVSPEQEEDVERTQTAAGYTTSPLSERNVQVNDVVSAGVLRTLARTTRALLKENPGINKVVVTGAIQGYKKNLNSSTVDALSDLFESKADTPAGIGERERFAASGIKNILVMVDELTGDGAGGPLVHELANWVENEFITHFNGHSPFTVSLIIADASLGNEVVLDRYLNSGERAPDKVLVSESSGDEPFRLALADVHLMNQPYPTLHIMTNSFPACSLVAEYRVQMEAISPGVTRDGKPQTFMQALRDQQGEAQLNLAVAEITRGLQEGSSQVIYFAQDKAFLRDIQAALTTSKGSEAAYLAADAVAILDSSVPPAKRKELLSPHLRDNIKVFLMTSSGARGVSFPKTDWIIASMPRFNVEGALMELAQLVYRGRGKNYYRDDGTEADDGDWKARRLVFLVQEFYPEEESDLRTWLRRASDLLTFLVMIRSTLLTRIKGDAGLDRSRLALVPVGGVGTSELFSLMSQQVGAFLKEAEVFIRDSRANRDWVGTVKDAQSLVVGLFSRFVLETQDREANLRSITRTEDLSQLTEVASSESAALLVNLFDNKYAQLPEHLYCAGPFWAEHWKDGDKTETYQFDSYRNVVNDEMDRLTNLLWALYKNHSLSWSLRSPAKKIFDILIAKEDRDSLARDLHTLKNVKSSNTWVVVPVDYTRFWRRKDGQPPSLGDEHDGWRDALARCITTRREALPVIARYEGIPYAAVVGQHDPLNLETVFDDRYFMASQELNLLNTVLLADDYH